MAGVGADNDKAGKTEAWRIVDLRYDDPDELGILSMHFHIQNVTTGRLYLLSLSGDGNAPSTEFEDACYIVARAIDRENKALTERKQLPN